MHGLVSMPHFLNIVVVLFLLQCSVVKTDRAVGRSRFVHVAGEQDWLASHAGASLIGRVVRELTVAEPLLCGGNEIRGFLDVDADFDVKRVMAIRFEDAINHANTYISKRREDLESIVRKLKDLEDEWYKTSGIALEGTKELSDSEITDLFTKVIAEAYGSVGAAAELDCLPPPNSTGQVEPYTVSEQKLRSHQEQLLQGGRSFPGIYDKVQGLCHIAISVGTANCDKLCRALAAIAVTPSTVALDAATAKLPSLGQLTEDVKSATRELQQVIDDIHACGSTREGLMAYKMQVDKIKEEHGSSGKQSRDVQMQLDSVLGSVKQYEESTATEQQLRKDLQEIIEKSKVEEQRLRSVADTSQQQSAELRQKIDQVTSAVQEIRAVVQDSQKVVSAVHDFKASVVVTMQSFLQVYNDTVREPLKGLSQLADRLKDDAWPNVGDAASEIWSSPKRGAGRLKEQCASVATAIGRLCSGERPSESTPAGDKLQSVCAAKATLESDCSAKLAGDVYVDDLRVRIGEQQDKVKEFMHKLKAELDSVLLVVGGKAKDEPEYLRRFDGVLHDSKLYREYVAGWAAGSPEDGPSLKMAKMVEAVVGTIANKAANAESKLKELNDEWLESVKNGTELVADMQNLSSTMLDQQAKKTELDTKFEEYQKHLVEARANQQRYQQYLKDMSQGVEGLATLLHGVFDDLKAAAHNAFGAEGRTGAHEEPALPGTSSTTTPTTTRTSSVTAP